MSDRYDPSDSSFHYPPTRWDDPNYTAALEKSRQLQDAFQLELRSAFKITPSRHYWLFENFVTKGEMTVIMGAPNVGKSTLACLLIAGVTSGTAPEHAGGLTPLSSGHVVVIDKENDIGRTIIPRLRAAGADLGRVHFVGQNRKGLDYEDFSILNPAHQTRLEGHAMRLDGGIAMIVYDHFSDIVEGDQGNNTLARKAFERAVEFCRRLDCALVCIAHTIKNPRGKGLLDRLAGPHALRQVPRTILLAVPFVDDDSGGGMRVAVVRAKNNNGKTDGGFAYEIKDVTVDTSAGLIHTSRTVITNHLVGMPEAIVAHAEQNSTAVKINKSEKAELFLRDLLKDVQLPRRDIEAQALDAGIASGTLLRAKANLKLVTAKRKGDGLSVWSLPTSDDA